MIFVTVGSNTPFDRLIDTVDQWAGRAGRDDVFAQIGDSELVPRHIRAERFLTPERFQQCMAEAQLVVAHAGMGTILSAVRAGVPLIVMARRAALGEMRNDHQLATAERLGPRFGIRVAQDEAALARLLDEGRGGPVRRTEPSTLEQLRSAVREFVDGPAC